MLILGIYCRRFFALAEDWSGFDTTDYVLGRNSDDFTTTTSYDDNLWDLSSDASVDSDDGLLLVDSPDCASWSSSLGRRDEMCRIKKPSVEVRPLGRTKDAPLVPPEGNYELCLPDLMGYARNLVFCDSGSAADRHPSPTPGAFDLINCTPCTCSLTLFSWFKLC